MQPPTLPALHLELTTPQTVDGRRAPFQSLWLLVRLAYAHRLSPEQPFVRLADLRGAVSDASTQRMMISRAFRDWQNWGVQAGWGEQRDREPRFLNADKRSQGPFWLTPEDAARVVCLVEGRIADDTDVRAFLGIATAECATDSAAEATASALSGPAPGTPNPAFWHAFLTARHAMREGRLLHALGAGTHTGSASDAERGGALLALRHAGMLPTTISSAPSSPWARRWPPAGWATPRAPVPCSRNCGHTVASGTCSATTTSPPWSVSSPPGARMTGAILTSPPACSHAWPTPNPAAACCAITRRSGLSGTTSVL
ncbi:hypothetical protein MMB19_23685 [Ralstonia insidiosa]|nr:hypothetical protein MMB19_23685 [Ralstonia insidiosa]